MATLPFGDNEQVKRSTARRSATASAAATTLRYWLPTHGAIATSPYSW